MDGGYEEKPLANDSRNGSPVRIPEDSDADFLVRADSLKSSAETGTGTGTGTPAPKPLPFEFKVLEACIESACRCLESEVCTNLELYLLYLRLGCWLNFPLGKISSMHTVHLRPSGSDSFR